MPIYLNYKSMKRVQDSFNEYDMQPDVILFHKFNLLVAEYSRGEPLKEGDQALIHELLDRCGGNPILRWLALDFLSKNATVADEIIQQQEKMREESSFKLSIHERFSLGS